MAEVRLPCPVGGVVPASGYKARQHIVSLGQLRALGK
jgi:hypothetical protein